MLNSSAKETCTDCGCHERYFQLHKAQQDFMKAIRKRRDNLFELVKDIPFEKLDIVDRERWAIINELNSLLGDNIVQPQSEKD